MIARPLAALLALLSVFAAVPLHAAGSAPLPELSVYNLPSQWTTQDGKPVRLEALRGRPVVVAMIYLNCPDVCPLIVENMQRIEADLPKGLRSGVAFAVFSFDAARDNPARLKAYAAARGLDGARWTLFHGDEAAARTLAAALDVTFRRKDDGNYDHSIVISLLDASGVVVYRQVGLQNDTRAFVSKITGLAKPR
jgi:protein SCO1/2